MNRIATFLVGLALLVTAMVPPGYMAAQAEDGAITVRICGTMSGKSLAITPDNPLYETFALLQQHDGEDDSDGSDDEPCDMGTTSFVDARSPNFVAKPSVNGEAVQISQSALTGIFPSGLPPATGPPLS